MPTELTPPDELTTEPEAPVEHELLTPLELSAETKVPTKTLAQWRYQGTGPRFLKLGGKHVRYRRSDVDDWLRSSCGAVA